LSASAEGGGGATSKTATVAAAPQKANVVVSGFGPWINTQEENTSEVIAEQIIEDLDDPLIVISHVPDVPVVPGAPKKRSNMN